MFRQIHNSQGKMERISAVIGAPNRGIRRLLRNTRIRVTLLRVEKIGLAPGIVAADSGEESAGGFLIAIGRDGT